MGADTDWLDEKGDGVINGASTSGAGPEKLEDGRMVVFAAPQNGGIVGLPFVHVLLAWGFGYRAGSYSELRASLSERGSVAGRVFFGNYLAREEDFSGSDFLAFPEYSKYDLHTRRFTVDQSPGATFYRVVFSDNGKSWIIYVPKGIAEFTVPIRPEPYTFDTRGAYAAGKWRAEAVHTIGELAPADLVDARQDNHLDSLAEIIDAFSIYSAPREVSP